MPDIFNIGVSALLSSQRMLGTIGHNIANANTPGYSRQRVEFEARPPQILGNFFVGKGVNIADVSRLADQFLINQVRTGTTNHSQSAAFLEFSSQLNNLLADAQAGLSPGLNEFFNGLQDLGNHPSSVPTRQTLLSQAQTLVARFHEQFARMDEIALAVNDRIEIDVDHINELAQSIADINRAIAQTSGQAATGAANDLLDRRDQLLEELSGMVGVQTFEQDDGAINVTIGNGQVLVVGGTAMNLVAVNNPFDASRKEVAYDTGAGPSIISAQIGNGELGALLNFRDDLLDPTRNALGRMGVTLAQIFNAQHREGMDLTGALGGDFFSIPAPAVNANSGNTGTGTVVAAFDPATVGNLTISDYTLTFSAGNFSITRLSDNTTTLLGGAGSYTIDGMTLTLGGVPVAGDSWRIQPTRQVPRDIGLLITDARNVAAANPLRSRSQLANLGDARVTAPDVTNAANANLLDTVTITFDDPPTTFDVVDTTTATTLASNVAYTSGMTVSFNGWSVQLTGAARAGDQLVVEYNAGGVGDNTNARLLAALQAARVLDGGTANLQDAYGSLIGEVGAQTHQAEVNESALKALLEHAVNSREEVSGVNLDEEAADLLKFQQVYQAAARVVASANQVFEELLNAVRT